MFTKAFLSPSHLPPIALIVLKHKFAQTIQSAVECTAVVDFREFLNKFLQPLVFGDHEGCDRDFELAALRRECEGLVEDLAVEAPRVFVVFNALLDASGLAVGDHEDLLVACLAAAQQVHGELQACDGIRVVGTDLQVGQVFDFDLPSVVAKDDDVERVFGVTRSDELGQGHRGLFGRGDAVLAIEDHRVADVDHEHRRAGGGKFLLMDFQVILREAIGIHAMVDLRVADRVGHRDLL